MSNNGQDCGCWFCHKTTGIGWLYTREFDCDFHPECLEKALAAVDEGGAEDIEAEIIAKEYDIEHTRKFA